MKAIVKIILLLLLIFSGSIRTHAQVQEAIQLALNIEKLNQLRQILKSMYDAYKIIYGGYDKVKNITSGNYKLHEVFMDGLMAVNPKIKNYGKVADIIQAQSSMLSEYKAAYRRFSSSSVMRPAELKYLMDVYSNLMDQSLQHIEELTMILTSGNLKMSDDERLEGIDRIYDQMQDKLSFLRSFNNNTSVLVLQRTRQLKEVQMMQQLYNLRPQ